jgi:hypothetical protein
MLSMAANQRLIEEQAHSLRYGSTASTCLQVYTEAAIGIHPCTPANSLVSQTLDSRCKPLSLSLALQLLYKDTGTTGQERLARQTFHKEQE